MIFLRMSTWALEEPNSTPSGTMTAARPPFSSRRRKRCRKRIIGLLALDRQRGVHVRRVADKGVTVREEENVLRLIGAEENVNQCHGYARLARAGGHDEECTALVGGEGLGEAANGLVLVGAVDDGAVDGGRFERSSVLAQELQPL